MRSIHRRPQPELRPRQIPVKLYSATESAATVRFNLLAKDGSRVKQQYVSDANGKPVERSEMVKATSSRRTSSSSSRPKS